MDATDDQTDRPEETAADATSTRRRKFPITVFPSMTRFLLLIVAVQVLLPLLLAGCRNSLIFFPAQTPAPEAGLAVINRGTSGELVRVPRPDGRELAAYDVRAPRWRDGDPVVLFCHGNAGNIANRADLIAWFAEGTHTRALLFDYSGYGGNAGSPSEDEVYVDALAAFDWLVAAGVRPEQIIVYGESLGGAVACYVATERPCAGLVVQSSFSSLSSMAWSAYPWMPLGALLVSGAFPSAERIATLEIPVLVAHGDADGIVPFSEGEALHAAAPGSEFMPVSGADHNDFFHVAGPRYLGELRTRFRMWVGLPEEADEAQGK